MSQGPNLFDLRPNTWKMQVHPNMRGVRGNGAWDGNRIKNGDVPPRVDKGTSS